MQSQVLVIDDDDAVRDIVEAVLNPLGFGVAHAATLADARQALLAGHHGVVLLDRVLPDGNGEELLGELQQSWPHLPVIVLTGHGSAAAAVDAVAGGAVDFVEKRDLIDRLGPVVQEAQAMLTREDAVVEFGELATRDGAMRQTVDLLRASADSNVPVLIRGESGTGKELLARGLHQAGRRQEAPFVAVNCAGIPPDLLESEMFGHVKGAFTGAVNDRPGLFGQAAGGTLFLDEIGELPMALQAKLLRVLQTGEYRAVGGDRALHSTARIVSATHRDLEGEVSAGLFREDVYYRLSVFTVWAPALRERRSDVVLLARRLLSKACKQEGRELDIEGRVLEVFLAHPFPGNVRELENVIRYSVIRSKSDRIRVPDLPPHFVRALSLTSDPISPQLDDALAMDAPDAHFPSLAEMEARHIDRALARAEGNKAEAARLLGISRMKLYRHLESK